MKAWEYLQKNKIKAAATNVSLRSQDTGYNAQQWDIRLDRTTFEKAVEFAQDTGTLPGVQCSADAKHVDRFDAYLRDISRVPPDMRYWYNEQYKKTGTPQILSERD